MIVRSKKKMTDYGWTGDRRPTDQEPEPLSDCVHRSHNLSHEDPRRDIGISQHLQDVSFVF